MEESANRIEYSGSKVIKTFASRSAFITESRIYQKLRGSGLAAEMTDSWDGVIELERLEGENFREVAYGLRRSPDKLRPYFDMFFDWYVRYREITSISIGDMDFGDFILTEEGLKAIDFEHCRAGGFAGQDVSRLAASICLYPDGYTSAGLESAKQFLASANAHIAMDSRKLYKAVMASLADFCSQRGIASMPEADEYVATFASCRAVIAAEKQEVRRAVDSEYILRRGATVLADLKNMLSCMPERTVIGPAGEDLASDGYSAVADAPDRLRAVVDALGDSRQRWALVVSCGTKNISEKILRYLLSAGKEHADVIHLREKGEILEYPVLLRPANTLPALIKAAGSGCGSIAEACSGLRTVCLDLEAMKGYEPGMGERVTAG